jgi:hypothetical protein
MILTNSIDLGCCFHDVEKHQNSWASKSTAQQPLAGGCPGQGQSHCVEPGANGGEIFQDQTTDFQKATDANPKNNSDSLVHIIVRRMLIPTVKTTNAWVTFLMTQQLPLRLHSLMI